MLVGQAAGLAASPPVDHGPELGMMASCSPAIPRSTRRSSVSWSTILRRMPRSRGSASTSRVLIPLARIDAHRPARPASFSRSSMAGTERCSVVTTAKLRAISIASVGRGLADLDHRLLDQLLQAVAAVLAEPGQHDGVVRLVVGEHAVHHADRGQVALKGAVHRLGAERRAQRHDCVPGEA